MIVLHKINGNEILINYEQIEHVDETPDTVITLLNGNRILVKESLTEVQDKVIEFKSKIQSILEKGD